MTDRNRRRLIQGGLSLAGLGLLSGCGRLPWQAQPKIPRVGYLDGGVSASTVAVFLAELHQLGYRDGQTVAVELRNAEGNQQRLPALAAELVEAPVDVIVVRGNEAAIAASQATSSIPIVAGGGDIIGVGLVANLAHPEGNVTGVSSSVTEVVGKWVELLKEAVPSLARLAAVLDLGNPFAQTNLKEIQRAGQAARVEITPYDLRTLDDLPDVLATAKRAGVDGLALVSGGRLGGVTNPVIGGEVLKAQLPAIASSREFAATGGLVAYGSNTDTLSRRAAVFVDKILKGARPGDLPVEQPTQFDFVVNLKTAQALGLTLPQSILQQATEVIQ